MDKPLPTKIQNYDDAVRWIYGRINYEHTQPRRSSGHFRLERIEKLLDLIDAPQKRIPAVHLAGTKGKGSTAAMVDSILRSSGYHTGLFTSPHIRLFEERMKVDGRMPDESRLTQMVARLAALLKDAGNQPDIASPTYFEVATLLGWMYFDECKVDIAVLETGLGGRLDCTNVCRPLVTAITTIGLDHTHILGDTLEKIAAEKAGIIKPGVPVISGVTQQNVIEVLKQQATAQNSPLYLINHDFSFQVDNPHNSSSPISITTPIKTYDNLTLSLAGGFQRANAALATVIADQLAHTLKGITETTIRDGLASTVWPLRLEVFAGSPTIVLDAAHNPDAMAALIDALNDPAWKRPQRIMVFAASQDKDAAGMLNYVLPAFDHVVLTRFETNPRGIPVDQLAEIADRCRQSCTESGKQAAALSCAANPETALTQARLMTEPDDVVCVAGSIFLSAEVRGILTG
jgi:dihydrofolate synthase/folylpolyglutamate synthase